MRLPASVFLLVLAAALMGCNNSKITGPSNVVTTPTVRFTTSGRVTSEGAPLADAEVAINFGQVLGSTIVKTDADGKYTFNVVSTQIGFEIRHPGFYPGFGFASLTFSETNIDMPRAQHILVGDTVTGAVGGSIDNFCSDTSNAKCQVYTLTAPASGEIQVDLSWTDPVDLRLAVVTATDDVSAPQAPRGHLTMRYAVAAGGTYDIWVVSTQLCKQFELTVKTVEPEGD